jgi:hypothetical protein
MVADGTARAPNDRAVDGLGRGLGDGKLTHAKGAGEDETCEYDSLHNGKLLLPESGRRAASLSPGWDVGYTDGGYPPFIPMHSKLKKTAACSRERGKPAVEKRARE